MALTRKSFDKYGLVSLGGSPQRRDPLPWGKIVLWALPAVVVIVVWWWVKIFDNFDTVVDQQVYRSGQLSPRDLERRIEKYDLQSVINLRAETQAVWWVRETLVCQNAGVQHINVPIHGSADLTPELIDQLVDTMSSAPKPMLIHCRHGADRAGLASALYLLHLEGQPIKVATRELMPGRGHLPLLFPVVRKYRRALEQSIAADSN